MTSTAPDDALWAAIADPSRRRVLDILVAHGTRRSGDTTLAFASRVPQPDIERRKLRMGWSIPWYTMTDGFDTDSGVDEWHGTNVFIRDGESVFRTYFINKRGDEAMGSTWISDSDKEKPAPGDPDHVPNAPAYSRC